MQEGESIEFSGKAIANLAADADVIKKTGRILQVLIIICDVKCTEYSAHSQHITCKKQVCIFFVNFPNLSSG